MSDVALIPLCLLLLGYGVAWLALGAPRLRAAHQWVEPMVWAPGIAFGVPSLILFLSRAAGWNPPHWPGLLMAFACVALALGLLSRLDPAETRPEDDAARVLVSPLASRAAHLVLFLFLASAPYFYGLWSAAHPDGLWDAVAIWNTKARILAQMDVEAGPVLSLQHRGGPGYPVFAPASHAQQWLLAGDLSSSITQTTGFCFFTGLIAAVYSGLRRLSSPFVAAVGTTLLLTTPVVFRWVFSQYVDTTLAYLVVAAAGCLAARLDTRSAQVPSALLAGLLLGLAAFTKSEAVIHVGLVLGAFVVVSVLRPEIRSRTLSGSLGWIALGLLPGLSALVLFKLQWGAPTRAGASAYLGNLTADRLLDLDRAMQVMVSMLERMNPVTGWDTWGATWALIALAVVLGLARWRSQIQAASLFLALIVVGYLCAIYFLFVASPLSLSMHMASTADRLMLQVLPVALLMGGAALGQDGRPRLGTNSADIRDRATSTPAPNPRSTTG